MRKCIVLLFAIILFCVPNVHSQQRDAKTELKEAERLYNNKEYYSASYIYKYFSAVLNPEQRFIYAFCLVNSNPSTDNVGEAIRQLKTASSGGNSKAMLSLYYIYTQNKIASPDRSQAIAYIRMAADYENEEGMYIYGSLLNQGDFISRDTVKAYRFIEKAAAKNFYQAISDLGYMHYAGRGAEKNLSKAEYYWKKAAESGAAEAVYNYSFLLLETNKNIATAIANLQSIASKGFTTASLYLGSIYNYGQHGIPRDTAKAIQYYKNVMQDDGFKKNNKEMYDTARAIVARYGAVEPVSDHKLLRTAFDNLIKKITRTPVVPENEKDKRIFILNQLENEYKDLRSLGFRNGTLRFGRENTPLNSILLTKPFHTYETNIVEAVTPESVQRVYLKWVQILQKMYPEHTLVKKGNTSGIHFMLTPETGYIGIYITLFDYYNSTQGSQVFMTVMYTERSK